MSKKDNDNSRFMSLKRKCGESILIDNQIEIIVKKISKSHVQLVVKCPKPLDHIVILRKELLDG